MFGIRRTSTVTMMVAGCCRAGHQCFATTHHLTVQGALPSLPRAMGKCSSPDQRLRSSQAEVRRPSTKNRGVRTYSWSGSQHLRMLRGGRHGWSDMGGPTSALDLWDRDVSPNRLQVSANHTVSTGSPGWKPLHYPRDPVVPSQKVRLDPQNLH